MGAELDGALARLSSALGSLETAVTRHFDVDARRSDLEVELEVMQDDRARLAVELEGASAHLARVEAVAGQVGNRVRLAIEAVEDVLARAETGESGAGLAGEAAGLAGQAG